jgi:hypothetical protein
MRNDVVAIDGACVGDNSPGEIDLRTDHLNVACASFWAMSSPEAPECRIDGVMDDECVRTPIASPQK